MKRNIVNIDREKCNGCGACVIACHEGAIAIIEGKAVLTREDYCDGLGNCLPNCPMGAITIEEREALPFDEAAVAASQGKQTSAPAHGCPGSAPVTIDRKESDVNTSSEPEKKTKDADDFIKMFLNLPKAKVQGGAQRGCPGAMAKTISRDGKDGSTSSAPTGPTPEMLAILNSKLPAGKPHMCPGAMSKSINRKAQEEKNVSAAEVPSFLRQWPVQIKLVPVNAPYFKDSSLLIAADCTAYSYGNFHRDFIKGRITLIGCPKLDDGDYSDKLSDIIRNNSIKDVTVVRMIVPCCGGIEAAARNAVRKSGKDIPLRVVVVGIDGELTED